MKEAVKLKQTFIKMIDRVIIDLLAVKRHLKRMILPNIPKPTNAPNLTIIQTITNHL
jgi:hypothetical protein